MLYKYNIPRKQQHFNLTNGKLVYCFHGELIFFRQNKPKDCFQTLYSPAVHKKISCQKRFSVSTNTLYILHINKQPAEYIGMRVSQQVGETCFLNSEMPKSFHACPSINKSAE